MNLSAPHFAATLINRIALGLLTIMPISALGSRFDLWSYKIGLLCVAIALIGGLIIEIICAIWLLQKPKTNTRSALRKASLYALPPLILIAGLLRGNTGNIMLHDITTDTQTPPVFQHAITLRGPDSNTLEYSPAKAAEQIQLYPQLAPIINSLGLSENTERAIETAKALGWVISYNNRQKGHIEAIDTTFWFGFKDDIAIRAQQGRIDLRSTSRIGKSDLGANTDRIERFIAHFQGNN